MPFAVTVDYETVEKDTVTLRERDSRAQVCGIIAGAIVELGVIMAGVWCRSIQLQQLTIARQERCSNA